MLKIGNYELHSVINGTLRLDGGAMFGVVPKALWQSVTDVDEHNRIPLAARSLVAFDRSAGRLIVVDTGCGSKWDEKNAARFAIEHDEQALPSKLGEMGLSLTDVTDVVITHLHFDHNGGLTDWYDEPGGKTTLRFPNARHWVHRMHLEHARSATPKDRASFVEADIAAVEEAGVLSFIEGDAPAPTIDGVRWMVSQGHTTCQLHPEFVGDDRNLLFVGDLVPTIAHLRLGWVMAYDLRPLDTIRERQGVYQRCIEEGLLLAFPHDPTHGGAMIGDSIERPVVRETLDL